MEWPLNPHMDLPAVPLNTKQCKVRKLNDTKVLKREKSADFKELIEDTFWASKNSIIEKQVLNINCF